MMLPQKLPDGKMYLVQTDDKFGIVCRAKRQWELCAVIWRRNERAHSGVTEVGRFRAPATRLYSAVAFVDRIVEADGTGAIVNLSSPAHIAFHRGWIGTEYIRESVDLSKPCAMCGEARREDGLYPGGQT